MEGEERAGGQLKEAGPSLSEAMHTPGIEHIIAFRVKLNGTRGSSAQGRGRRPDTDKGNTEGACTSCWTRCSLAVTRIAPASTRGATHDAVPVSSGPGESCRRWQGADGALAHAEEQAQKAGRWSWSRERRRPAAVSSALQCAPTDIGNQRPFGKYPRVLASLARSAALSSLAFPPCNRSTPPLSGSCTQMALAS